MKYIALYRVSTAKQDHSGLGLKAQQEAVRNYVKYSGGEILEEVVEVESGSNKDRTNTKNRTLNYQTLLDKRPKLKYVIERAEKEGATIIVKEPSRLTRFSMLMNFLLEYKIPFKCSDSPNDDAMMLKLRTVFAEDENIKRSERTKLALQQKKKQGVKLGRTGFSEEARKAGIERVKELAKNSDTNRQAMYFIARERESGASYEHIAGQLNKLNYRTRKGNTYSRMAVKRLAERRLR